MLTFGTSLSLSVVWEPMGDGKKIISLADNHILLWDLQESSSQAVVSKRNNTAFVSVFLNQTLHVLTHRWELNNEITWTQGGEHHTPGPVVGKGKGAGIALGDIPNVNDELMGAAHPHGTCIHM